MDEVRLKEIPGFKTLKAMRWGRYWYIVDCTYNDMPAYCRTTGGYHCTYGALCVYTEANYTGQYS